MTPQPPDQPQGERERMRDEMMQPAPAGEVMPNTPGDLARPRPSGIWHCPGCGMDITDAVTQIVQTALKGAHPAAPEQGEAQARCGGSKRIPTSVIPWGGDYGREYTEPCPGCRDCKQGEAQKRWVRCNRCLHRWAVPATKGDPPPCPKCEQGEAASEERCGSCKTAFVHCECGFTRENAAEKSGIPLAPAPPEAASVCPTCESPNPAWDLFSEDNPCPDPFHDTPLPADQERCECGEPDTRHVVHRSDGPCYQYEDAAESAPPEESAEEPTITVEICKRSGADAASCGGYQCENGCDLDYIECVPASLLTALQAERDEAVANLNHPYLCSCGQGPHGKGTGIMGSDTPEPGPDCRPLTWQEVAERASEAAGARRKEGHEFFLEKRRAEARSSSLEAALERLCAAIRKNKGGWAWLPADHPSQRDPSEREVKDAYERARSALANSPTEADE